MNEAAVDPISGPLVLSCSKCKTIVGDSFSFLSSNEQSKTITLSAASNIQRSTQLYTSYEPFDEGSTYFDFMCSNCQQMIGRYYVTTSMDLDHIREKFTFNVNFVTSYELGKAQHGQLPEAIEVEEPKQRSDIISVQEEVTMVCQFLQQITFMIQRFYLNLQVQTVMIDIVRRVKYLEEQLLISQAINHSNRNNGYSAYNHNESSNNSYRSPVPNNSNISNTFPVNIPFANSNSINQSSNISNNEIIDRGFPTTSTVLNGGKNNLYTYSPGPFYKKPKL